MKKILLSLFFVTLSIFGFCQEMNSNNCKLQTSLRKLWSDHVIWTRQYIVAAVSNTQDASAALDRLMKNQEDLGNAIATYYGREAGSTLANLLKEHIALAGELVKAAINNSKENLKNADMKWHYNAEKIASFLSKANPYLPKKDLQSMLNKHLELTTNEAIYRINEKWGDDVSNFDKIYDQALSMADTLAKGIQMQFPNK